MSTIYDLVVIGTGPGGYVSAIRAAQLGMKVAVAETRQVGGTCLNRGCIPTKALLHSAELYEQMKNSHEAGIFAEGISYDMGKIQERRNQVQDQMRAGIESLFKGHKIELFQGKAWIKSPGEVEINGSILETKNILIAAGSEPNLPPIPGIDLPFVASSDDLLTGKGKDYKSLIIIGGGVIGVEFAVIYSALGCEVTVIEAGDRIIANMDKEISRSLAMTLKKKGVTIHTKATVKEIRKTEDGLAECVFMIKDQEMTASAEGILVAVGRRPNTGGLMAENMDLELINGKIPVDSNFSTCIKGIYAIGDIIHGGIQLAHVASAQGLNAVCHMAGREPAIDMNIVPSCIYTNPEIAQVGITADDAKTMGLSVKTGKYIMSSNGKTVIERADRGFIKVVFDKETDVILGAQMMCSRATDLISEFSMAIRNKSTIADISSIIRPHPTFSEAITEAAESVDGMAIHMK